MDVERGCGNVHLLWTPSTIQCLNDLYASTFWPPWWSVSFPHDTGLSTHCGYAEVADHEKSYRGMYSFLRMVDFQLDWGGLVTAVILTGQIAAEWCIQIGIWYRKQMLWLKRLSLSLTFDTVITGRDDVVPYWGAWCSAGDSPLLLWLVMVPILIYGRWFWTPALLRLEQLVSPIAIGTIGLHRAILYLPDSAWPMLGRKFRKKKGMFSRCRSNQMLKLGSAPTNEQMFVEMPTKGNQRIHEQLSEWNNEPMSRWINEPMSGRINESMKERNNKSMNQTMNQSINQWAKESVNQWSNEAMKPWIKEWVK